MKMIPSCSSGNPDHPNIITTANFNSKRKRRPAGTPDPDAEVVSLSPKTLLESDRYVCEICNQGFQRDQNLQMHRRRHKVPWKLLKREKAVVRKRVFVCPEASCLHHDPCHALGDLVGIKKHFRRKHSNHKQWSCLKCSKAYAVQSDYKAHLKTCGSRGHSCNCGRVFSRVESFIEHQDTCNLGKLQSHNQNPTLLLPPAPAPAPASACLSQTASSPSPSTDTNYSTTPIWPISMTTTTPTSSQKHTAISSGDRVDLYHNLDLQLSTSAKPTNQPPVKLSPITNSNDNYSSTHQLQISIGSTTDLCDKSETNMETHQTVSIRVTNNIMEVEVMTLASVAERKQAKRLIVLAERELAHARRIRQQAQSELQKAKTLRDNAVKQITSTLLEITCHSCKIQFQLGRPANA
uniref:C2H2-type domain-containing protein n=1 Tax=Kalanchoe fedtschenkoi TaxID=63787 RepID=A0A7N0T7X3_KALFE